MSDQAANFNIVKRGQNNLTLGPEEFMFLKEILDRIFLNKESNSNNNYYHSHPTVLQQQQMPINQNTVNEQQAHPTFPTNRFLLPQQQNPHVQINPVTYQQVQQQQARPTTQQIPSLWTEVGNQVQLPNDHTNYANPFANKFTTLQPSTSSLMPFNKPHQEELEYGAWKAEVTSAQGKILSLTKELENKDQLLNESRRACRDMEKKFYKTKEELEKHVDDLEKAKLQVLTRQETIDRLESHQNKLKKRRLFFQRQHKENKKEIEQYKQSNDVQEAKMQKLKQSIRERETEIDNLKMELEMATMESSDANAEASNYKMICEELKGYVLKLEDSVERETKMRMKLKEMCPPLVGQSFDKSMQKMLAFVQDRELIMEKRKRHADSDDGIVPGCSYTKKLNLVHVPQPERQENAERVCKSSRCQPPKTGTNEVGNSNKEEVDNHKNEDMEIENKEVQDEITITETGDGKCGSNGDGNQKQVCSTNVTISLPQWKQLQESTTKAIAKSRRNRDLNNIPSASVPNLHELKTFKGNKGNKKKKD